MKKFRENDSGNKQDFSRKLYDLLKKPHIIFVAAALVFGTIFLKMIGPTSLPDYNMHLENTLALATWQFPSKQNGVNKNMNISVAKKWTTFQYSCSENGGVNYFVAKVLEFSHDKKCSMTQSEIQNESTTTLTDRAQYSPVGYIPQAIGTKIGMMTNQTPARTIAFARISNLIFYVAIFALAIYLLPRGKWLLTIFGLLPTSIFLASSISGDAINIAFAAVFVAYVLKVFDEKKKISRKQNAMFAAMGFVLFFLKVAYAPLWLLYLAFAKNQISRKKKWAIFAAVLILGAIGYLLWSHFFGNIHVLDSAQNNGKIMTHSPVQTIISIITNVIFLPFVFYSDPNNTLYLVISGVIFAAILFSLRKVSLPRVRDFRELFAKYRLQFLAILAAFSALFLTFGALMLTWTNLSQGIFTAIIGFQGRYILPILPLICVIFFLPISRKSK